MKKIIFISFLLTVGCLPLTAQTNLGKPNVIFIMADDMGYGDPKCYNAESKIPTPNMDKLAQEGMLFTNAHSASSVCTPSRYSLITGKYAWRSDLKREVLWSTYNDPLIGKSEVTIADMFKSMGYATGVVGKWHLGINFMKNQGFGFVQAKDWHEMGLKGSRDVNFMNPSYGGPNDLGFDYFFGSGAGQNMEPHVFIENRYTVGLPTIWREKDQPTKEHISAKEVHEGWMVEGWDDTEIGPTLTEKSLQFIE
ncbi:MAG TPA: sulfatase-like hydrolase/transferase, partial [Arenibacter sp.]|nr:sulfatase-like hydrolase/transferase [Arenibacter sp.]